MHYSKELINEVKRLYPDHKEMIQLAEQGNSELGKSLDVHSQTGMTFEDIISTTSLEELQKEAKLGQRKLDLWNTWRKEWKNHQRLLKLK